MNTINSTPANNVNSVERYYIPMRAKDVDKMDGYLH
jgi:hypothetical protein